MDTASGSELAAVDEACRYLVDLDVMRVIAFEDIDEPPRWLRELAEEGGLTDQVRILEEGTPYVF